MYNTETIAALFRDIDEHLAQCTEQESEVVHRLRVAFGNCGSLDSDSLVTLYEVIDNLDHRVGYRTSVYDDDGYDEWS